MGNAGRDFDRWRRDENSLSSTVAQYAAATTFDALPAAVRTRAAQIVLDQMAGACFGMHRPAGELAARHVASSGGRAAFAASRPSTTQKN